MLITFSCVKAQNEKTKQNNSTVNSTETTTYYFVRHAEKDNKPANNPKLLPTGKTRARNYAKYFSNIKLDAIYSTNLTRTKNTVQPTAKSQGLKTIIYNPTNINYSDFLKDTRGKKVLIVGHTNTIPGFVNRIIGTNEYQEIDESIYNQMYIVTITDGEIKHELKTVD